MMVEKPPKIVQEFIFDRRSGSAELTSKALAIFKEVAQTYTPEEFIHKFNFYSQLMLEAQPSMAAVINNILKLRSIIELKDRNWSQENICEYIQLLIDNHESESARAVTNAVEFLRKYNAISTFSRSSLVEKTLLTLGSENKKLRLFLSESAPGSEGSHLAENLSSAGINITFSEDTGFLNSLIQSQALIFGADAIAEDAFCNKIGTKTFSLLAKMHNIPVFVIATSSKILTPEGRKYFKMRKEIAFYSVLFKKTKIRVTQEYFEWCPNDLVTNFILDEGIK